MLASSALKVHDEKFHFNQKNSIVLLEHAPLQCAQVPTRQVAEELDLC
jgi:hypothetical protein